MVYAADQAGTRELDARIKLLALLVLLVALALVQSVAVLAGCYVGVVALWAIVARGQGRGGTSRDQSRSLRLRWVLPLLVPALLAALPATLSIVTPGTLTLTLWHWHDQPHGVTAQGLTTAARLVLRAGCSVTLVLLVTMTTPWSRLLQSLTALGIPRVLVLVTTMAYRYVFLLLTTLIDIYHARRARTIQRVRADRAERRFAGGVAGFALAKSASLADEVHQAMTARGFRGHVRLLAAPRPGRTEVLVGVGAIVAAIVIVWSDHVVR